MECRDVRSLADDFLSEELLVETTAAVLQHLERCPTCRADVGARRTLRASLRSAFGKAPELDVRPAFLDELHTQLRDQADAPRPRWSRWWAVAAGAVLAVGLGSGSLRWWAERGLVELSHLAAGDHQNCALKFALTERPIPLSEAAAFDPAFARLDRVELGSSLPGRDAIEVVERHSCVFQGQRFAHIVARYKGVVVSLVVADEKSSRATARAAAEVARPMAPAGGFSVASFHASGHTVFVVATLPPQDVDTLAKAVTAPIGRALAGA